MEGIKENSKPAQRTTGTKILKIQSVNKVKITKSGQRKRKIIRIVTECGTGAAVDRTFYDYSFYNCIIMIY